MRHTNTFLKVLLICFLVLLSAGQPSAVSAGEGVWTSIGPEGGLIHALVIDPVTPTTLYAGTYRFRVGLYNWATGEPLIAFVDGVFAGNFVVLEKPVKLKR